MTLHFVFDENYSYRIAEGLNVLEGGNLKSSIKVHVVHINSLFGKPGAPDENVIRKVGEIKGILFTKDKDFKHIKSLYPLYRKYKVGVVFFKQYKRGTTYWDNVKALVEKWEDIKLKIKDETAPFVYEVSFEGVKRFEF